ncbi:expressed unknown protein [Seminavis robusta]|uniref:Uncharacterized protein n=1 Tax=Seminavis robusta TaxID=568900 RepID=A0A9N8DMM5_9STRA|nr:expressed unknown protein [Seminavis robusta]|eukprot:Sro162_g072940.1 n/a (910) ;mRNA; f:75591-78320
MSCEDERPEMDILDVERTCERIEKEVFGWTGDYEYYDEDWDQIVVVGASTFLTEQHIDFLNQVRATDDFCLEIKRAYPQCRFCDPRVSLECSAEWSLTTCGGRPSLQEILQDNETYPLFVTDLDIHMACDVLIQAYEATEDDFFASSIRIPSSIQVCEYQNQIKHLCPGFCEGGCFDEIINPPSCNPEINETGTPFDEQAIEAACSFMLETFFRKADVAVINNVSVHWEYLRGMDALSPEGCEDMHQLYARCPWCKQSELCFDETNPLSCDGPTGSFGEDSEADEEVNIEEECLQLSHAIADQFKQNDLYDLASHQARLTTPKNSSLCDRARKYYHKCIWCDKDAQVAKESGCLVPDVDICIMGGKAPEGYVSTVASSLNLSKPTGEDCDSFTEFYQAKTETTRPTTIQACYEALFMANLCPIQFCISRQPDHVIDKNYLGATTQAQKRALIWLSRVAAILSFLGASYILYDTLSDKKARTTTYHQLLVGMATFDIVTAFAWRFATLPIDADKAGHVEGAMGNAATCKTQAFFIQLGFTSVFFNVSLAIYYVLVVAQGWKEFQLQKIRLYLLSGPVVVGLGLAFGALPIYHWLEYGCHIEPLPEGELWSVLVFVVLPLGLSILAITASMMTVYCTVRKQSAAAKKWTMGISQASKMEQAVFWQCLFYVMAFYITWPILFSVYLASLDDKVRIFGLSLTVAFVAPLQGFNNFLVYIRPKLRQSKKRTTRRTTNISQLGSSLARRVSSLLSKLFVVAPVDHGLDDDDPLSSMDPSAALPLYRERTGFDENDNPSNPQQQIPAIPEDSNCEDDDSGANNDFHDEPADGCTLLCMADSGSQEMAIQEQASKQASFDDMSCSSECLRQQQVVSTTQSDGQEASRGVSADGSTDEYPLFPYYEKRKDWSQYLLRR